ncbi:uncharacterized protein N7482_002888 [Penicillium canariense]|uniref:Poly [ADP-ribose] polymerase n=1 Tax=Penicillium canariense TaxID=189055 RepID=A0A9W9IMJ4_9EURO|nr:uncharacterized protein N7482_002888 [Penicillium canariense]KAJ5177011.1 hypothetical protein N7482_002888 [Penicillium canariense]
MTPTSFAGVVIAASGNIPGQRHEAIKRMVEDCGATFEKNASNYCTHLVTTQIHVDITGRNVCMLKMNTSCEIVSFGWLFQSILEKHPVNTEAYLLTPTANVGLAVSQPKEEFEAVTESNKRKYGPESDKLNGLPKKRKSNIRVYHRQLAALVDDQYDRKGADVAIWMDEHYVRWDATVVSNLSELPTAMVNTRAPGYMIPTAMINTRPPANMIPTAMVNTPAPAYKVETHRLQLLYNFHTGSYRTWFRLVDEGSNHGELYGCGDVVSAKSEFKRLFKRLTSVSWEKRHSISKEKPFVFIQPSFREEQNCVPLADQAEVRYKLPTGVPKVLNLLFGHSNRSAVHQFFKDVAISRVKTVDEVQLSDHTLRTGIAILKRITTLLTETPKIRGTRSRSSELVQSELVNYLSQCYRGLMWIGKSSASHPGHANLDWVRHELQDVHLLLNLRVALEMTQAWEKTLKREMMQQAFQTLDLDEIKQVRKRSMEYEVLATYLKGSVGSLHSIQYKEILNIFRIRRRGEHERLCKWRSENKDKVGGGLLLWHGSGCEKFIGILSQGLRVRLFERSSQGMFGAGIYFADMSGKSARYCSGPGKSVFMLLCEVDVGRDPVHYDSSDTNAETTLRRQGKVGLIARGRSGHMKWMDAEAVHRDLRGVSMPDVSAGGKTLLVHALAYNEYVVYDPAQIRQRYLFHVQTS